MGSSDLESGDVCVRIDSRDGHTHVEGAGSENYSLLYHRSESMNMLVDYKRVATINVPRCSWERFVYMYMYVHVHVHACKSR